ncbi:NAD(P)-dependent oxidoreductase [Sphingomonas sp. 28-63-12]|uniref:NAD(P)-dependent oxidoreductase n=1 Tax=Sphingomonas sp. 28-63-12 TaxID=1970434 RepID=UPI000BD9974C|nr:MAG: hypothetical protein B7Y47_09780 [Sphingomonas sp. 28-63-12]
MTLDIATIGFGEAASTFAPGWRGVGAAVRAYDIKLDQPLYRSAMAQTLRAHDVNQCATLADAVSGPGCIISLVTADQALAVAQAAAESISAASLWFDMNSVSPHTKRAAGALIEGAGGLYVDVAVMSPVEPARLAVPLLVSGRHASAGAAALTQLGFSNVRIVPGDIGRASAIKMIRSVMVKGIEALTAECVLAAEQAGVLDEVIASLDASWPGADWGFRADYNLDRMLAHGTRRAAEMEEVVKTLDTLGTGSQMSRSTAERQRALGALGIVPAAGLPAKLAALALAAPVTRPLPDATAQGGAARVPGGHPTPEAAAFPGGKDVRRVDVRMGESQP